MTQEQAHEWLFNGTSAVVSAAHVKELTGQANRTGRVGLYLEDLFTVGN
jgi:hypothetical protein